VSDSPPAIHQNPDLPSDVSTDLGQLSSQLVVEEAVGGEAAAKEAFELANLTGFEAVRIAKDLDGRLLDASWRSVVKG
jgi:hypothetical protein